MRNTGLDKPKDVFCLYHPFQKLQSAMGFFRKKKTKCACLILNIFFSDITPYWHQQSLELFQLRLDSLILKQILTTSSVIRKKIFVLRNTEGGGSEKASPTIRDLFCSSQKFSFCLFLSINNIDQKKRAKRLSPSYLYYH